MDQRVTDLQRIGLKFFFEGTGEATRKGAAPLRPRDFIPVFHGWIQTHAVDGLLIDVADYEEYRRLKATGESSPTPKVVLSRPAPDGLERLKRAVTIGWKGIDAEDLKRRIRESRKISTRPPVKL